MKKIIIFILLALSITFVNAQRSKESSNLEKFNLKPIETIFDNQLGKIDKETNALRINRNQHFKSESKEASEIAWSYLQAKQDVYGISNTLDNIKMVKTIESPAGTYSYFCQYIHDIPVYATNFIVFVNKDNAVMYALNEFRNIDKYGSVSNKVSIKDNDALKIAYEYLNVQEDIIGKPSKELVYFESIDKGLELAWEIHTRAWQVFVSAETGRIIHAGDTRVYATGIGNVFKPNPLVSANEPYDHCCSSNNCLSHNSGASNPCLESQLVQVTLNDLTFENGVYKLKGPYCSVEDIDEPHGHNIPELSTTEFSNTGFRYTRDQEEFAAVMCYYYVDLSARRMLELGYQIPNRLKNVRIDPHGEWGDRDARYDYLGNYISMGSGYADGNTFVPPAEDSDWILHEHGHAICFNFGTVIANPWYAHPERNAVYEGSADYWATSYKRWLYPNSDWAAWGLWFDMGDSLYLRRTDLNLTYPPESGYHIGGQIWSSALMKIWGDLGRDITDQLFLETHLNWGQEPLMRESATAFMQADLNLYNGEHLCQIFSRFEEHNLIDPNNGFVNSNNNFVITTNYANKTVNTSKTVFSCTDLNVQDVDVTSGAKLTLDAVGGVNIINDFKVELGSELKIK